MVSFQVVLMAGFLLGGHGAHWTAASRRSQPWSWSSSSNLGLSRARQRTNSGLKKEHSETNSLRPAGRNQSQKRSFNKLSLPNVRSSKVHKINKGHVSQKRSSPPYRPHLRNNPSRSGKRSNKYFPRRLSSRKQRQVDPVKAGVDFSLAVFDPEVGKMCVTKEEEVASTERQRVLECTHKSVERCHYTYVTQFKPSQEEVCEENFEKSCQITFKQQAYNETVRKCYRPTSKVCNGEGPEECRTVYESSCTTKYVEKQPGKFVGDTGCEKLPVEICGAGCTFEEGEEECHDKVLTSVVDVPEEVCDLNPQKTCRFITKLVPRLKPTHQCTIVPQEVCQLKFSSPQQVKKPLLTKWCLDETPPQPGEIYPSEEERSSGSTNENGLGPILLDEDLLDFERGSAQLRIGTGPTKQKDRGQKIHPNKHLPGISDSQQLGLREDIKSKEGERTLLNAIDLDFELIDDQRELEDESVKKNSEVEDDFDYGAPPLDITLQDVSKVFSQDTLRPHLKEVDHHNHIEDVNNEELEEIEVERLKNFLAEDLESRGDLEDLESRGEDQALDVVTLEEGSGGEFITFPMDDTFPTQDFSAFVDFQDF